MVIRAVILAYQQQRKDHGRVLTVIAEKRKRIKLNEVDGEVELVHRLLITSSLVT